MVIIHTIEGGDGNVDSGAGYFFDRVTGGLFAAPVFMAAMGIGMGISVLLARVRPLSTLKI